MLLLIAAVVAFSLAAILTKVMISWLASRGALAHENDRTMHAGVIPKGGGLALLIAALAVTALLFSPGEIPAPLATGLFLVAAVSWRDDVQPLPARVRLPVHFLAAAILVFSLPENARVLQGLLPYWPDRILALIALTWMMNLFNFMDGINGIAGMEAVAIGAGYLLIGAATSWNISLAPLAAAIMGASAGFLVWNLRNKASVFMGDIGSVPLGYLTGAMMIDLAVHGHWAAALIIPAYFLADATLTLLRRFAGGEKVWEAHKTHFYQRAAQAYGRHLPVVWRMSAGNMSLLACALWSLAAPWASLTAAAVVVVCLLALFSLARKQA